MADIHLSFPPLNFLIYLLHFLFGAMTGKCTFFFSFRALYGMRHFHLVDDDFESVSVISNVEQWTDLTEVQV